MKGKFFRILLLSMLLPLATLAQDVYEIKFILGVTQYRAAPGRSDSDTTPVIKPIWLKNI